MSPLNPDEASALVGRDILVCWGLHGTRRGYIYITLFQLPKHRVSDASVVMWRSNSHTNHSYQNEPDSKINSV